MNKYLKMSNYVSGLRLLRDFVIVFLRFLKHGKNALKDYFCTDNPMKYEGEFLDVYTKRDREKGVSLTKEEVYTIYSSIKATRDLEGDIAEVGVWKGGSAKVICEIKGDNKGLYLFDTFEGMPDGLINPEKDRWREGSHTDTSLDQVKEYLKSYNKVYFLKGLVPNSIYQDKTYSVKDKKFCFVHLDVDLYQSTLKRLPRNCFWHQKFYSFWDLKLYLPFFFFRLWIVGQPLDALKFFWPRMTQGGRIVSHNYNLSAEGGGDTPGVKAAFLEYFKGGDQSLR